MRCQTCSSTHAQPGEGGGALHRSGQWAGPADPTYADRHRQCPPALGDPGVRQTRGSDPNYLADRSDLELLRIGVRMAMQMARRCAARSGLGIGSAARAGLAPTSDTDQAIDEFVRANTFSFYHPSGSARWASGRQQLRPRARQRPGGGHLRDSEWADGKPRRRDHDRASRGFHQDRQHTAGADGQQRNAPGRSAIDNEGASPAFPNRHRVTTVLRRLEPSASS